MIQHKLKENVHTEFKSSFNDTVIETLVAFANTNGGKVLIGVDNEGVLLKNFMIGDETLQQWLNEIKNKTQPALIPDSAYIKRAGGKVVELFVKEFPIKPVSFKGRYPRHLSVSTSASGEIVELKKGLSSSALALFIILNVTQFFTAAV